MEIRYCKGCGKRFAPKRNNQMYCCPEHRADQIKPEKKCSTGRKNRKALVDLAVEARKNGMSYGQYVAMIECGMRK